MPKYIIPIMVLSKVEVEADNLEEALNKINNGNPDIPGVNKAEINSWEINEWEYIEKDNQILDDENGNLYLSDILDKTKY